MPVARSPVPERPESTHLPFGVDFQKALIKVLCEDAGFAACMAPYLKASYFEAPPLAWAYSAISEYREKYGVPPSLGTLLELTRTLTLGEATLYGSVIDSLRSVQVRDEAWLRDQTIEFVKRGVFAKAFLEARELFNTGKYTNAYDTMMAKMDELRSIQPEVPDRGFFFDELPRRQSERLGSDPTLDSIGTGIGWLDKILDGGLSLGELGLWLAYAKGGKSTMLTTLGVNATRICSRRVLHCVFEGSRKQVELRYDTAFVRENYGRVKRGDISHDGFMSMQREYDFLRHKLVVRGFTDSWDYTVMHVQDELRELKQRHGFVPELIIIDYGDLLGGRDKHYHNETAKQQAAYRDLKSLSNRGYAVWTASQAQRPKEGAEDSAHLLKSRDIADAYAKVRVADFIGSLNQTRDERKQGAIRLYAELYRDNAAEQILVAHADFSQMRIWAEPGARGTSAAGKNGTPALGYDGIPTQPRVAL